MNNIAEMKGTRFEIPERYFSVIITIFIAAKITLEEFSKRKPS